MNHALLFLLICAPITASIATRLTDNARVARRAFATGALAASVAAGLLGARTFHAPEALVTVPIGLGRSLAYSAARAPFVGLATLVVLVVALVVDRRQLGVAAARRASLALVALVFAHLATDLAVLGAAFLGLAGLIVRELGEARGRAARGDTRLVAASLAIGVGAAFVAALATSGASVLAPLATDAHAQLDAARVPAVARDALVLACMVGLAVFPFHLHLPRVFESASLGTAAALLLVQPALVVAMHAVLPILGSRDGTVMSVLAIVSVAGAAYATLGALGTRELRPMLGYLVSSQNALVLAGLATRTSEGGVAAVLSSMATALTGAGLLVLAHELEARAGRLDLRASHGFAKPWPRLGASYLLLALANLGFPGSLQFFSEDLLLQGFLASHPVLAYGVLLVTAVNGVTVLRSFFALFFGPNVLERADYVPADLRRRELLGPTILLSTLAFLVVVAPSIGALVER